MNLTLLRYGYGHATLGVLRNGLSMICYTLEEPWRNNARNVSCIPVGTYEVVRHTSPKFGQTFLLKDVPNRSEILVHSGNSIEDTRGCILVGLSQSLDKVHESRKAMTLLRETVGGAKTPIILEIKEI